MILAREMPSSRIAKKERGSLPSSSIVRVFSDPFIRCCRVSEYMAADELWLLE